MDGMIGIYEVYKYIGQKEMHAKFSSIKLKETGE
jgi:hypothetical protein